MLYEADDPKPNNTKREELDISYSYMDIHAQVSSGKQI
jgi:hypothetical protein